MVNYILYDAENTVSILINYSEMRDTMDNQKEITYINNISVEDYNVHPDYQGCHIGTELIRRELDYIQKDVVAGETVMVSLMAAYHRESFYEKFGFHTRPFGNHGPGMSMWVSRDVTGNPMTF